MYKARLERPLLSLILLRHFVVDVPCIDKNLDMRFGAWEDERGVTLILQDINTKLQEKNIERGCVLEFLRDALGTIWDFLHCDASLT
ncbi:hypothetical protein DY000_02002086 [Brassica cretica]|uniref:DUF7903 domain-containing protein n=1 Tax=Brassica cretica TaxID=69181 RepID=A0ABQ7BZ82_BRACR|nr:hypothetical protein DY000_02002086 [Brassica cretica]